MTPGSGDVLGFGSWRKFILVQLGPVIGHCNPHRLKPTGSPQRSHMGLAYESIHVVHWGSMSIGSPDWPSPKNSSCLGMITGQCGHDIGPHVSHPELRSGVTPLLRRLLCLRGGGRSLDGPKLRPGAMRASLCSLCPPFYQADTSVGRHQTHLQQKVVWVCVCENIVA